jgi:hypothetical protein
LKGSSVVLPDESSELVAAYHEAGHAVAAFLVHHPVTGVSIVRTAESAGHCGLAPLPGFHPDVESDQATILRIKQSIFVTLAGYVSENIRFREPTRIPEAGFDVEHDTYRADRYCIELCADWGPEAIAYRQFMWERTRRLMSMRLHRWTVRAVARRLFASKTLSRGEVEGILAGTIEDPYVDLL